MSTIQSQVLRLVLRIDPHIKDTGVLFTAGTVGTADGGRFSAQRIVDIYNEARLVLFGAMRDSMRREDLEKQISGTTLRNSSFSFTLSGSVSTANLPSGYVRHISLSDASNNPIYVYSHSLNQVSVSGVNPHFVQGATNRFVVEEGLQFKHIGTFIPTASTYVLVYFGIPTITLTDVTNGTSLEVFNVDYEFMIIELAEAIALEYGLSEVNRLAKSLLNKK